MSGFVKQEQIKVEDSNMAGVGSEEDKSLRKEAAEHETAWIGAGEHEGVEVWRINQFKVEKVPESEYGEFYTGDSYIILHTYKKDEDSSVLDYDLYFWIGKHSTQDEYGTAAYKTVELDSFLDDKPVQHREVQDNESSEFVALFKETGIKKLAGGYDSGFRKVTKQVLETKLFKYLEMKNNKKTFHTKEISLKKCWEKLNADYVYALQTNEKIYLYHGSRSNFFLRNFAASQQAKAYPKLQTETLDDNEVAERFLPFIGVEIPDDFDITRKRTKVEDNSHQSEDVPRLFRVDLRHYESKPVDEVGEVTDVYMGDEIKNLDDLEVDDNILYVLDFPGKEMVIHEKSTKKRDRKKKAAMCVGQELLNLKATKRERRARLALVKDKDQFVLKCKNNGL